MGFSNDEKKAGNAAGFRPSSYDSNKMIDNSGHWVKKNGDSNIFSTSRHNEYGSMSKTEFGKRLNK